jgi:histidyl-tRNA synthetase
MLYQAPRGTVDILPAEQPYWRHIEQKIARICQLYGYERIDFPVFEDAGLFQRGIGTGTDIVEKETYTFADKGGNQLTLRPEGTASACRAYLEHGMQNLPQPVRLFYLIPAFRYERPQAGRYRQHHQFGIEVIGDIDPAIDAEVIDFAWQFFYSLELSKLNLFINSIGCKKCRPDYLRGIKDYYAKHSVGLCADCQVRMERNPLRLLDCKQDTCQPVADAAPRSVDYLCPDCRAHFDKLKGYLKVLEIPFTVNHRLVRGLDYYTRTVFEIQPSVAGSQGTICGGGRYDDLIEELGGKPTPADGFAIGIERIVLNLKKQGIAVPPLPRSEVFIACIGEIAKTEAVKLANQLRQESIGVIMATGDKSLKAQMRQANSLGMKQTVIIGEEEVKAGTAVLRDMAKAEQKTIPLAELPALLKPF